MTKQEAIRAMQEGKKVRHRYFDKTEWATMEGDYIIMDDGVRVKAHLYWADRVNIIWGGDWELFSDYVTKNTIFDVYLMLQRLSLVDLDIAVATDSHRASLRNLLIDLTGNEGQHIQESVEAMARKSERIKLTSDRISAFLGQLIEWKLPATGKFWDREKLQPTSYETEYGSNGARDYFRSLAIRLVKDLGLNIPPADKVMVVRDRELLDALVDDLEPLRELRDIYVKEASMTTNKYQKEWIELAKKATDRLEAREKLINGF
jgi:hypothetical protein